MFRSSYHTHNLFCDGTATIEEVVLAAIAAGLGEIGISSHAPLPWPVEWIMPRERLDAYLAEVRDLRGRYADRIAVLLGAEIDYIPDAGVIAFQRDQVLPAGFDYLIGSVHFLGGDDPPRAFDSTPEGFDAILRQSYGGDIRAMVAEYYLRVGEMMRLPGIRIVGHLDLIKRWNADHRYFQGDEPWYLEAAEGALRAIAAAGRMVELNTAAWRRGFDEPYPAPRLLARCRDLDIPIVVNADAHAPSEVTRDFDRAHALLAELGITASLLPPA